MSKPGKDVVLHWRGSVTDLVTDIEPLLTDNQLAELAGETALAWRKRRLAKATVESEVQRCCARQPKTTLTCGLPKGHEGECNALAWGVDYRGWKP